MGEAPLIGVLALQGGFAAHAKVLHGLGARVREVRVPSELAGLQGLVIPGGESTTMTLGIEREGLAEPLRSLAVAGTPILGSCAGLIMLDREHLGLMDIRAQRNAFGRQAKSFEADLDVAGLEGGPLRGIFIRAPWIAEYGPNVRILAEVEGHPVAAREANMLAVSFHAELSEDDRLHKLFLSIL
ncbi:MAG TPA: pyridoxal 5'-phosphate synthase glutaminase subunit PdxT [Solirubrobacteraceae bacterium]|jgi:5'-phosphate synthase pdxT subunit|nr:pyridoxal 5'-phosphate synthase glutaminase subunit PdxT [Solirubrobacteraceae bacterium]